MTPAFFDPEGLRDRVKQRIARDPQKSINGLAEALGVPKDRTRQWKSEYVGRVFRHIEKSFRSLDEVSAYLGLPRETLLFQDPNPTENLEKQPHPGTPSRSSLKNLTEQDRRLVEALVQRLSRN